MLDGLTAWEQAGRAAVAAELGQAIDRLELLRDGLEASGLCCEGEFVHLRSCPLYGTTDLLEMLRARRVELLEPLVQIQKRPRREFRRRR